MKNYNEIYLSVQRKIEARMEEQRKAERKLFYIKCFAVGLAISIVMHIKK